MAVTLRQRRLVAALVRMREGRGLNVTQAAELAGWRKDKLSRAEAFKVRLNGDDTYTLCEALGADEETKNNLWALARKQKERGWWHTDGLHTLDAPTVELIELEADANVKKQYCNTLLPGLCQIEDYMRALFDVVPQPVFRGQMEERVAARMRRQSRILDGDFEFWLIVDQLALFNEVGSPTVMASQLDHLADLAEQPSVNMQILPRKGVASNRLETSFSVFTLSGTDYANVTTVFGGAFIEEPVEVAAYRSVWQGLSANALDYRSSVESVRQAAKSYRERRDYPP